MSIKRWIWQHPDWPAFKYEVDDELHEDLYRYAKSLTYFPKPKELSEQEYLDLTIDIMVIEGTKSSQIEGEKIDPEEIRSSLINQLGKDLIPFRNLSAKAQGIADLMYLVRRDFKEPLTKEMLFDWHNSLMLGANPYTTNNIGTWRVSVDDMQIVSGAYGKEKIHYLAPPSASIDAEMNEFISWFNSEKSYNLPGPIRAAISHLYFECIHPFEDGNGRIGRAIVEKSLSQEMGMPIMFAISDVISKRKKEYYYEISQASGYQLNITKWIKWFTNIILESIENSKLIIQFTIKKANFWKKYENELNNRQSLVIKRMLKEGISGFAGGISAKKYMSITGVSKATATRDLIHLLEKGCIYKLPGQGKNTRYDINL